MVLILTASISPWEEEKETNLVVLIGLGRIGDVGLEAIAGRWKMGRDDVASFGGTGGPLDVVVVFCCCSVEYFCMRSPIFTLRRDMGMRLTRISMRVRRLCAWMS